jgi:hypothetical protein
VIRYLTLYAPDEGTENGGSVVVADPPSERKVEFTQAELDAKFIDAKTQAKRSLLTGLGFDKEEDLKAAIRQLTELREQTQTEQERTLNADRERIQQAADARVAEAEGYASRALVLAEIRVRASTMHFRTKAMDDVERYVLDLMASDDSSIKVHNGKVDGVERALADLAREKDYLIEPEETPATNRGAPSVGRNGSGTPVNQVTDDIRERAGIGLDSRRIF